MRVLAHRYELTLPQPEIPADEIQAAALEQLTYTYLAENCRYNLSETTMRLRGGHRMSEGMSADVAAARIRAEIEFRNNPEQYRFEARKQIEDIQGLDRRYHQHIAADCENWTIEIIGPMPKQIGMCDYAQEV